MDKADEPLEKLSRSIVAQCANQPFSIEQMGSVADQIKEHIRAYANARLQEARNVAYDFDSCQDGCTCGAGIAEEIEALKSTGGKV